MDDAERAAYKEEARHTLGPYLRSQVALCERVMGPPQPGTTRYERYEGIREGIRQSTLAYRSIVAVPVDDEKVAVSLEILDEIISELQQASAS